MRALFRKSLSSLALAACLSHGAPNWKPLFNGASFAGWHTAGDPSYWTINAADSSIVGASTVTTPYTMVFSDSTFDQFTIKYSYRLRAGCSGFFFRSVENSTTERVAGVQVEAKFASGKQSEVGSLYNHPSPGWVSQHSQAYSDRIAKTPSDQYQDVVLTVKRPYVYVNVNGYQAVGETDATEIGLGAKAAWSYTSSPTIVNPGRFGLQIHGGQNPMDVRFKRIAILCGDSATDSSNVPGLPKQPAVYGKTGVCAGAVSGTVNSGKQDFGKFFGLLSYGGNGLSIQVVYPGAHSLEIVSLRGQLLFTGSAPAAHEYRISEAFRPGVYLAKIKTGNGTAARKIVVP